MPIELKNMEGSFGKVKVAMNKFDCQPYAVKIIMPQAIPELISTTSSYQEPIQLSTQFREIVSMMKLNHKNIVRAYNWWLERVPKNPTSYNIYIQMEYVGNYNMIPNTLNEYITKVLKNMEISQKRKKVFQIFSQIWEGL